MEIRHQYSVCEMLVWIGNQRSEVRSKFVDRFDVERRGYPTRESLFKGRRGGGVWDTGKVPPCIRIMMGPFFSPFTKSHNSFSR